jgi:hypothetical protein
MSFSCIIVAVLFVLTILLLIFDIVLHLRRGRRDKKSVEVIPVADLDDVSKDEGLKPGESSKVNEGTSRYYSMLKNDSGLVKAITGSEDDSVIREKVDDED